MYVCGGGRSECEHLATCPNQSCPEPSCALSVSQTPERGGHVIPWPASRKLPLQGTVCCLPDLWAHGEHGGFWPQSQDSVGFWLSLLRFGLFLGSGQNRTGQVLQKLHCLVQFRMGRGLAGTLRGGLKLQPRAKPFQQHPQHPPNSAACLEHTLLPSPCHWVESRSDKGGDLGRRYQRREQRK